MNFRERIEGVLRAALLLFILASAAFLSALMAMRFAIQGREVTMPDVVGKKTEEAQTILRSRNLGLKIEDRIYSSMPVGTIARQSPPAGTRVKIGQYAHVVLSLGPQTATVPALAGETLRAARIELLRDGLQVGEITNVFVADAPTDTVVQQEPAPGSTNATSPHVDLLVSLGARPPGYVMPGLAGLPVAEAKARISAAQLKVSRVIYSPLPGTAQGTVVGQTPPRGSRVQPGDDIELQVAE